MEATSGVPVTLLAQFQTNGVAATPELPITLTVIPSAGGEAVLTTTDLLNPATGVYAYLWTPPAVDARTDFIVTFDPSGDDISAIDVVTVFPSATGAWCSPSQVENWTGVTVSAETTLLASAIIETVSGADIDAPADAISVKDRKHLAKATAWQAVWVAGKPGLITQRESAPSVTSDTQNIQRDDKVDVYLAPLARRELMNVSWIGTRSTIIPPVSFRTRNRNFLNEKSDPVWLGGEGAIP